jgi:membrane protein implicated in regulation of membrane protease activity
MDATIATDIWSLWWVWGLGAVMLLILEIFAPGFLFLGFGVGAGFVAGLLGLGIAPDNAAVMAVIFAAVSLIAWLAMRQIFGLRKGQVKVWDKDINDDV